MLGYPARQVGYAMAAAPEGQGIPWHRVVNSKGEISARKDGEGDHRQKKLLIEEGIIFDSKERIDLNVYGWIDAELPFIAEEWPELDLPQIETSNPFYDDSSHS